MEWNGMESTKGKYQTCHGLDVPPRPWALHPHARVEASSSRQESRRRSRMMAWEITEWQVAAFNYWECGCPTSPGELAARMGPWQISCRQGAAFENLLMENKNISQLSTD